MTLGGCRVKANPKTVVCLKEVSLSGAGVSIPDSRVRKNIRKAGSAAVLTDAAQD